VFGIPAETPFDLRFWLFGVHVRVHPMHWVISAVLGWGIAHGRLQYVALWVICVFVSVLIHEMGHVLMGRLFGSDGHIVLYSFGGVAIGSSDLRRRWQRILVAFAGPAIQFVLLGIVLGLIRFVLPGVPPNWQEPFARGCLMLFIINLFWPILNLLPIWPLDGGHICRELLEGALGHRGVIASLWISIVVAGALALQVLMNNYDHPFIPYGEILGSSFYNAIFFGLFCVASFQALQIENRPRGRWDDELPWER
jgi:stage IV sporulation protein FB